MTFPSVTNKRIRAVPSPLLTSAITVEFFSVDRSTTVYTSTTIVTIGEQTSVSTNTRVRFQLRFSLTTKIVTTT